MPIVFKPKITKYIRIPVELSLVRKITDDQHEEMNRLRSRGWGYMKLAKKYGVAKTTIMRHCNPYFRWKGNVAATKRDKLRRESDPEYALKHKASTKSSNKRILKEFPPARRYANMKKAKRLREYKLLEQ